jgi:flagellar basal-body rod modification protein FlgD
MLTQIGSVLTTKDSSAIQTPDKTALKKDDFLKLLIAQIKNQDPVEPINPKEFTEQLTALAQLEQSYNFTDTLKQFGNIIAGLNKTNTLSLLGRKVKIEDGVTSADSSITAEYSLPQNAELVKVQVVDDSGNVVREIKIPGQGAGSYTISWDGKDNYGRKLSGVYKAKVIAYNNGKVVDGVKVYSVGTVSAVNLKDESVTFGNLEVPLSKIVEVMG